MSMLENGSTYTV